MRRQVTQYARRGLGFNAEKIPKPIIEALNLKFSTAQPNWRKWSITQKAIIKKFKNEKKVEVKSLGFWQENRKQLLGIK